MKSRFHIVLASCKWFNYRALKKEYKKWS